MLTVDPADHRPAFRVVTAGFEHGDHLRDINRQQSPENRQPPGLFHDRRRSPGLTRQPDEEILPETEQRVRRATRIQPPDGQADVVRHRPVNQSANQPGIDRDFVVVENSGHSGVNLTPRDTGTGYRTWISRPPAARPADNRICRRQVCLRRFGGAARVGRWTMMAGVGL
jgi:hypothetical protein